MATDQSKFSAATEHEENVKNNDIPEHPYPSVVERYFTPGYRTDLKGQKGEDFCILKHSNRVCVVTLAKGHPLLDVGKAPVTKVDFQVGENTNRMNNKVTGKGKKGGQWLSEYSVLCRVRCADSTEYTLYSCFKAKLVEVNEKLLERPQLLQEKPSTQGFIAIVLPKLGECESQMENLLSSSEYEDLIRTRTTEQNIPTG
ncbi:protein Abitram-like [Amphiura filiformis]|uniref:protein Abitram-like n=1 Tax=Amphiura filiformis TaxID=82378 RepID=UPI003B20FF5A